MKKPPGGGFFIRGKDPRHQYRFDPSRNIFGVMKINSSVLLLIFIVLLNRLPSTGMSAKNGTLLAAKDLVVSRMPPSTTVWPSLTSTWVMISRVSIEGTEPPVALVTCWPTASSEMSRSRITRLSGVISGVTLRDSTAFLNWVVVAPLDADS